MPTPPIASSKSEFSAGSYSGEAMTTDHVIRPGETWGIESPDSRATWRRVKVIELLSRGRALVVPFTGPHKDQQLKVKVETFIQKEAST